jgi:hypothetical protein
MTTPIVGVTSAPRLTPYISVPMFKYHARRGVAVDQLVPRGMPADQDAALLQYIESAAAYTDSVCQQILAATYDTVLDTVNVGRDGCARVHPRYRPVIALAEFSIGGSPGSLQALADLSGVGVQQNRFVVPVVGGSLPVNTSQGPIQFGGARAPMDEAWIRYTYVNGFPVTALTESASSGATSISVVDTTGVVPSNTWLTIYAGADRFRFLAGAVSTAGPAGIGTGPGTVVCPALPNAVSNVGPQAVMVSALPSDVIEAQVLITRAFIKDAPAYKPGGDGEPGSGDDLVEAVALLRPYVAPVE